MNSVHSAFWGIFPSKSASVPLASQFSKPKTSETSSPWAFKISSTSVPGESVRWSVSIKRGGSRNWWSGGGEERVHSSESVMRGTTTTGSEEERLLVAVCCGFVFVFYLFWTLRNDHKVGEFYIDQDCDVFNKLLFHIGMPMKRIKKKKYVYSELFLT